MQHLEVSGTVRHIYIYIYVIVRLKFNRLLAAEVCASEFVMLDTPCSEVVKDTGYQLHSPVSPSLPLPCVTVCR